MVRLLVKRGDRNQFLFDTQIDISVKKLTQDVVTIYNGRLKIERICAEMEELAKYGPMYPPEILGLTEEQVEELKLVDVWEEKVYPSGGWIPNKDPIGRRNGRQPQPNMQTVLRKAIEDSKSAISSKLTDIQKTLTIKEVQEAIDILKGAVTIVYPMQLPPHDNIRMEFSNTEDLTGTQASLEIIEPSKAELWFAGKQMYVDQILSNFIGKNEKCKVIVKLVKHGEGPPAREPVLSEDERKQIMLQQYRRQEELKKLEEDSDDEYLNSNWADKGEIKKQVHGLTNIAYRSGFNL